MAANLINTSNRINANTAGQTRTAADVSIAPVSVTASEVADNLFGSMDSILSGGAHPEAVPGTAPRPLERATDSVRGRLGGLVPRGTSVTAPGPTGGAAAASAVESGARKVTDATTAGVKAAGNLLARFRPKGK